MYIQWGFLPDSKSLLISHTEPTPPDKSQRQGLTSSGEFLKVAVSTATAVYLVSSEGLSHRTCRGRYRHNTSPGALWRPRSCSACCLISTVQILSYWPFYSKFLLWFLLCSWKEMAEKSEGCGFHQIGSEGFSHGVCKRHIYYMLSETIYDHWELWSTRKVSIWNALAFLLKLNPRESVSMSERVSCSSNTRGPHYLGDLSEHFFQIQDGIGYPSEEQEAWLADASASTWGFPVQNKRTNKLVE